MPGPGRKTPFRELFVAAPEGEWWFEQEPRAGVAVEDLREADFVAALLRPLASSLRRRRDAAPARANAKEPAWLAGGEVVSDAMRNAADLLTGRSRELSLLALGKLLEVTGYEVTAVPSAAGLQAQLAAHVRDVEGQLRQLDRQAERARELIATHLEELASLRSTHLGDGAE